MRTWLGGVISVVLLSACCACDPSPCGTAPERPSSVWMVPIGAFSSSDRDTARAVSEVLDSLGVVWGEEGSLATAIFVPVDQGDQVAMVLERHPRLAGRIATIPRGDRTGGFQYTLPNREALAPK
jgi:hypothetical protein